MDHLHQWMGNLIEIELTGKKQYQGVLIDTGLDVIVIYTGEKFIYIPINHIQHVKQISAETDTLGNTPDIPIQSESISYRKLLDNAKGRFVEIYVTGNKSIHGYLTSIMNDYFVFYSPVYKSMFVALDHVKWIIPYSFNLTPYSLDHHHFPVHPTNVPLSRSFEQQCKRLEGQLVVFDLGDHEDKIGLLAKVDSNKLEIITANGETLLWNMRHLKTIHVPGFSS
jgi:hypothetical protein